MKHQTDILDAQISQGRVQIKYGFTDDETEKEYLLELIYKQYFNLMQEIGYYPNAQIIEGEDETLVQDEFEVTNQFTGEYETRVFNSEITQVIGDNAWITANEVLELVLEDLEQNELPF